MNFEWFFALISTFWEPCYPKNAVMENITPFPPAGSATSVDVVFLSCAHQMHFDPAPLVRLFAEKDVQVAEDVVCRMLEDIALRLDMMQRGLAAHDFTRMQRPAQRIRIVADQIGLSEVAVAAAHVGVCLSQNDGVALEATMARLERGFDVAVTEVWSFRDL